MTRVRVLGPRSQIPDVVRALQELGLLHLADVSPRTALQPLALTPRERRLARQLGRAADDVEAALVALGDDAAAARAASVGDEPLPRLVRRARRVRRAAEALQHRATALEDERALILKYRDVFTTLEGVLRDVARTPRLTAYAAVVPAAERELVQRVSAPLAAGLGGDVALSTHPLPNGDVALLLVAPVERATQLERALADAHVPEIPVPAGYGARSLAEVVPRMLARLREIPGELEAVGAERRALARAERAPLAAARVRLNDCLAALHATEQCAVTAHAFALEGWLPTDALPRLEHGLHDLVGDGIVVEPIERGAWRAADAPVVLSNPRIFRPFEALVRVFPLPTYGTIDPTPFVAVFFPLFFGVMLGDVGYGALLAIVAVALHRTARPGSVARTTAEIAAPCAAFAIIFGLIYGELFGDVGRRWLGMPALFDREAAILPALAIAIGIGVVHVLIGLVLGVVSRARAEPRHALGTGITALMLLLIIGALLAAFDVLPRAFFTPTVVALLVAFPILVAAEGIIGAVELLSTVGNVLSYARVMALGTASVLMAVVANKMVGAIGSTVVGLIFALLFHLVNFAIGLFSPAIHALRLHYVEFFGKFYSPGGQPYRPLQHWHPSPGR